MFLFYLLNVSYNTAKISVPLLLIHGEKNNFIPYKQLALFEQGLKTDKKSYDKIVFSQEGHGLFLPSNRNKAYNKLLAFLHQHIGNEK